MLNENTHISLSNANMKEKHMRDIVFLTVSESFRVLCASNRLEGSD